MLKGTVPPGTVILNWSLGNPDADRSFDPFLLCISDADGEACSTEEAWRPRGTKSPADGAGRHRQAAAAGRLAGICRPGSRHSSSATYKSLVLTFEI